MDFNIVLLKKVCWIKSLRILRNSIKNIRNINKKISKKLISIE